MGGSAYAKMRVARADEEIDGGEVADHGVDLAVIEQRKCFGTVVGGDRVHGAGGIGKHAQHRFPIGVRRHPLACQIRKACNAGGVLARGDHQRELDVRRAEHQSFPGAPSGVEGEHDVNLLLVDHLARVAKVAAADIANLQAEIVHHVLEIVRRNAFGKAAAVRADEWREGVVVGDVERGKCIEPGTFGGGNGHPAGICIVRVQGTAGDHPEAGDDTGQEGAKPCH